MKADATAPEPERPRTRWIPLDLGRGAAVLAMVAYHTAWDLSALRLIATEVTDHLGWSLFARAIAASFLVVSGMALALAHPEASRLGAFARRFAMIAAAAALVTAATFFAFPTSWIFFGILHNIALSSVIALPFLRLPWPATAGAALLVWLAPLMVTWLGTPAFLETPLLAFLGFGSRLPLTNDFVTVFPWTGFLLAGTAFARAIGPRPGLGARTARPLPRAVARIGRHSLAIYLLHQPLIYGALFGLVQLAGTSDAAERSHYVSSCERSCKGQGQAPARCAAFCGCNLDEVGRAGLWEIVKRGGARPDDVERLHDIAGTCAARTRRGAVDGDRGSP